MSLARLGHFSVAYIEKKPSTGGRLLRIYSILSIIELTYHSNSNKLDAGTFLGRFYEAKKIHPKRSEMMKFHPITYR